MKNQYSSFTEFAQEIDRRESMKKDLIVPANKMVMVENQMNIDGGMYNINDVAHGQLSNKLGIPKKYYDAMPAIPGLREHNVNAWLDKSDKNYMTRTLDGTMRALLSDRYKPMDNFQMLQSFIPVLNEMESFEINASNLSETKMYLQISFPHMEAAVKTGDIVRHGIIFSNSEVGHGAVDIAVMKYVLICKNGMIGSSVLRRNHIGGRIGINEEDYNLYEDDTIQADMQAFQLKLRDSLKNALSEVAFQKDIEALKIAAGTIIAKPESVIKNVTKHFNMNESLAEPILSNMVKSKDFSVWGLSNGITALAHNMKNSDHAYEVERIGNKVIELTPDQWEIMSA